MNKLLLNPEIQNYLKSQIQKDIRSFSLTKSPFERVTSAELSQQLKGLQIAQSKFPFYFEAKNIYYPPSINLEQASSWATAQYKANIVNGNSLIDLTAGMGIDSYGFAQKFKKITALERNSDLVEIAKYNYQSLNQANLNYQATNFETYFQENPTSKWDVIYLDPSRRIDSQRKVILEDLEPNILEWMNEFFKRSDTILVKLSPLLDLKSAIDKVPQIQEIHIVALKNEVKELLLICKNNLSSNPKVKAVNLETNQSEFEFFWNEETLVKSDFSTPQKYIYEANSSILKSGAFKLIGQKYNLKKLHINTHLYTSNELVETFPGKVFEVSEELKNIKSKLENPAFHVISKNYPMSVEAIRRKYKLKESESQTLIFTQSIKEKHILKCQRIL